MNIKEKICGQKKKYRTAKQANKALEYSQSVSFYQCPFCHKYHITCSPRQNNPKILIISRNKEYIQNLYNEYILAGATKIKLLKLPHEYQIKHQ